MDKDRIKKASKGTLFTIIEEIPYVGKPLVTFYKEYREDGKEISTEDLRNMVFQLQNFNKENLKDLSFIIRNNNDKMEMLFFILQSKIDNDKITFKDLKHGIENLNLRLKDYYKEQEEKFNLNLEKRGFIKIEEKLEDDILNYLRINHKATTREIAEVLNVDISIISYYLNRFKQLKIIHNIINKNESIWVLYPQSNEEYNIPKKILIKGTKTSIRDSNLLKITSKYIMNNNFEVEFSIPDNLKFEGLILKKNGDELTIKPKYSKNKVI